MLRRAPFATAATVLAMTIAVVGHADAALGRPTSSGAAAIELNEADPHLGSTVSFTLTYPKRVKDARYAVRCYQDGRLTYAEARPEGTSLVLGGGGSEWLTAGGPASCTAELFYFVWNGSNAQEYYPLAWTSFEAAG